jgi:hypothetical protein
MAKYTRHCFVIYKQSQDNLKLIGEVLYNYAQNLERVLQLQGKSINQSK